MIPLIQKEAVERYQWLSQEEFANTIAIVNSLPAPIATKLAGMIGYRVKGWRGSLAACLGAVLPTALIVIFLGSVLAHYAELPALQAMLKGVRPVVVVLLLQSAFQMGKSAFTKEKTTWILGAAALAILILWPGLNPVFMVIGAMILGNFVFREKKESDIT